MLHCLSGADAGNYALASTVGTAAADITALQTLTDVTSSITNLQQGVTGTSDTSGGISTSGTIANIGPGSGGGAVQQQSSMQLVSDHTVAPDGMTLNSQKGSSGVSFSKADSTMTLDLASGEAGPARQSFLQIAMESGNQTNDGETFEVVDRGNSLSLTPSGRFPIESIQITGDAGPSASGELRMPDGSELPITATLMPESTLLVTLPADASGIEPAQVSMIALSLVNKDLDVRPDHITSIVIRGK